MSKEKMDLKNLADKLKTNLQWLHHYGFIIFVVFVATLYAFVLLRVSSLSNTQPSASAVSSQVQAAQIPHIDQSLVNQLQSLQNNSVSVQALFNQARSNPFQ